MSEDTQWQECRVSGPMWIVAHLGYEETALETGDGLVTAEIGDKRIVLVFTSGDKADDFAASGKAGNNLIALQLETLGDFKRFLINAQSWGHSHVSFDPVEPLAGAPIARIIFAIEVEYGS